jgi:branched-chain amino acid aminotransferase
MICSEISSARAMKENAMLWYNGQLIEDGPVSFDLKDRGLLLGDGLFETLPSFNAIPLLLCQHLDRMIESAARIDLNVDRQALEEAVLALARLDEAPAVIRLTATRGNGPRGLEPPDPAIPLIFATRAAWNPKLAFGDTTLATVSIRRNPSSPTGSIKSLAYLDPVLALKEARARGADDALCLSTTGGIACTSMANLFILKDNVLITPRADGSILNGVTRRLMLEIAHESGIKMIERDCNPEECREADLVFTTNSVRFMTRVTHIDRREIGGETTNVWNLLRQRICERIARLCNGYRIGD